MTKRFGIFIGGYITQNLVDYVESTAKKEHSNKSKVLERFIKEAMDKENRLNIEAGLKKRVERN